MALATALIIPFSACDKNAAQGSGEEAVEAEGTPVAQGQWSALETEDVQNELAAEMKKMGCSILFTVLEDVVPEGVEDSNAAQHLNSWRVAYSISGIRDWLFEQSK